MPRYVVERSFARITDEDFLAAATRSDREAVESFPEITWEHSHVCIDDDGGVTTFCVYAAPDQETLRAHAEAFGSHSVARILELVDDVTPLDIRRRASSAGL